MRHKARPGNRLGLFCCLLTGGPGGDRLPVARRSGRAIGPPCVTTGCPRGARFVLGGSIEARQGNPLYNLGMLSERDKERFWSKVHIQGPDDCWPWMAARAKCRGGYGFFRASGRTVYAHRIAFEIGSGQTATGGLVCHRCNRPECCNPSHLYLGTHQTNGKDGAEHGLMGRWDRRGRRNPAAKLDEEAVLNIRAELAKGKAPVDLAKRYGVTSAAIRHIKSGRNWAWLTTMTHDGGQPMTGHGQA